LEILIFKCGLAAAMIEYKTFYKEIIPQYVRVMNQSQKEPPLFHDETAERLEVYFLRDPNFDPNGIFLAINGGRLVGYSGGEIQEKRLEVGVAD
jgi:hypothetical protein